MFQMSLCRGGRLYLRRGLTCCLQCRRLFGYLTLCLYTELQIAIHYHGGDTLHDISKLYEPHMELLELLGVDRKRIIHVEEDVRTKARMLRYRHLFALGCHK